MVIKFVARGHAVMGIVDGNMIEQGYENETLALVCLCYGAPGIGDAHDVAVRIAELLNVGDAEKMEDRNADTR